LKEEIERIRYQNNILLFRLERVESVGRDIENELEQVTQYDRTNDLIIEDVKKKY